MTHALKDQILSFKAALSTALQQTHTQEELEQIRITYLGRQGKLTELMQQLKSLSAEEKRIVGPALNELKSWAQQAYDKRAQDIQQQASAQLQQKTTFFDVTAYNYDPLEGSLHLYTKMIDHITSIFMSMGYEIADGPELEKDYYNFQALNIPSDHPARDMQDTFWISYPQTLLRTQTSNVQIHAMEHQKPPLAICSTGRVYRNEEVDASHEFMFMQVEALLVGTNISIANLIATVHTFLKKLFEREDLQIRMRPGYFPFVEPGIEFDASCPFCTTGCSTCKYSRWIELLGAGLVHPNVLSACGIDPTVYSGFAFGCGIERIAMIKYGIHDIRVFHANKLGFLKQF